MITYDKLRQTPTHFECFTGTKTGEFDELFEKLSPLWEQLNYARLDRPNRRRGVGGGPDYKLDLRDQLLMTLMQLHLGLNTEALGYCFDVDKSTVSRNSRTILPVLHQLQNGSGRWSNPPRRGQGKCIGAALQEYPDLRGVIEAPRQTGEQVHHGKTQFSELRSSEITTA
jgi:hypothetical protein